MRGIGSIHVLKKYLLLLVLGSIWVPGSGQITQVWPGDANENGVVSHVDLLYLGRWFGDSGPARAGVSINWGPFNVQKWLPPQAGRPDPAHADCNGDGTVNLLDFDAIEQNYGFDNQSNLSDLSSLGGNTNGAASLTATLAGGPLTAGALDTIWINLGDSTQPIDSLLGFATTLTFDSSLVDSAYAFFEGSWLGDPNTDLLTFGRFRPGELDIALTRIDQNNTLNGNGRIAGVVIVMTENLKKEVETVELNFSFSQALALTQGLEAVPVFVENQQTLVYKASELLDVLIYPIPASSAVNIHILQPRKEEITGRLFDLQGRLCHTFRFTDQTALSRNGLGQGTYILELRSNAASLSKRIVYLE